MIDVKVLRTDPDRVRASQRARGESVALVDELLAADEARRGSISRFEELLSAAKPILRTAARSAEPIWFSIQQVDLDALQEDF